MCIGFTLDLGTERKFRVKVVASDLVRRAGVGLENVFRSRTERRK